MLFAALAGLAAGFSIWGLCFLLLPLLLGGYASGLSFIAPRLAAAVAGITVVPFLILGISQFFNGAAESTPQPAFFVVPSAVVIGVSILSLLWSEGSLWSRQQPRSGKVLIGVFAVLPALFATCALGSLMLWLSGFQRAT